AQRGRAFARVAVWAEARPELERALQALASNALGERVELLVDLAEVCFLSQDTGGARRYATEALGLLEQTGREDLVPSALGWLGPATGADGDLPAALAIYERALAQNRVLGAPIPAGLQQHALTFYWIGQLGRAVERGREAVESAYQAHDTSSTMFALP